MTGRTSPSLQALPRAVAITLGLGASLLGAAAPPVLIPFSTTGPTSARINLVLLAEGYQQSERAKFEADGIAVINGILGAEPLATYRPFFNAYGIFVPSVDSGADHPLDRIQRNTYFNSTFNSYGTERVLTIPPNDIDPDWSHGDGRVYALLADLMPEYDLAAVVVNDDEYGGSGGGVLVVSTHWQSPEIATHELGHTFAHLGDEYPNAYPYPDVEEPNTTRETRRELLKWNPWVLDTTPLPTTTAFPSYQSVVGLFEGAHYHASGWYRPQFTCRMQRLGVPFCAVCSEALVLAAHRIASPVESVSPDAGTPVLVSRPVRFTVGMIPPNADTLAVEWRLNDVPLAPVDPLSLELRASQLPTGSSTLTLEISDLTPFVRSDPLGYTRHSVHWTVVRDSDAPPELAVTAAAGGALELSWPVGAEGFRLEEAGELATEDGAWKPVVEPPVPGADGRLHLMVIPGDGSRFFLLRKP
ncbi:MAG TPA: hypothetical protein DCM86_16080 [Verrucomicrobiales bacterium]|nr:hypothetical protein [Verrucomicrobiales bacterium]